MAPSRTFDYDLLKRLIREHPEQSYAEYAEALTRDVRKDDPGAPRVLPDSIRRVVTQYRDRWEDEGLHVPDRRLGKDIRVPLGAVSETQRMATPTRYLREIWSQREGRSAVTESGRRIRASALRWEAKLRESRHIVDITSLGDVIVRPAGADELDDKGRLIEITAWAIPGRELSPPSRRGRG